MCFCVCLCHCWRPGNNGLISTAISWLRFCAVPVFIALSFYLSYGWITESCGGDGLFRLRQRFLRLMIPYILWPMVALCFVDIIEYVVHGVIKYGWKDLLLQYLSGSQMREVWQLYYTWDLLIISIAVWGLFRLVGEKWAMVLLAMFSVTSLFFVYSNMNYEMTLMIKRNVFCSPVGRLAELLPYAFLGLLLRRFADKLKVAGYC